MFNSNCSTALTMPVAPVGYGYGNGGNGMFGDDSWIGLIIILALLSGGFGNGFGFGGFGGFGGGRGFVEPCATQADVRAAVDQQTLISKIDEGVYGQANTAFTMNNTIMNGFHGVDNAICTLGYQNQQGFSNLASQMASCCCETQRAIDGVNYNLATQACDTRNTIQNSTRDIIENQNANSRAILDFLTTDKIASLQAENQNLKLAASQSNQNAVLMAAMDANKAEILRRTGAECPTAAYIVQPPQPVTFPTNCCGQFSGYGYNNSGCGCC